MMNGALRRFPTIAQNNPLHVSSVILNFEM
jgi:hypothetical protein